MTFERDRADLAARRARRRGITTKKLCLRASGNRLGIAGESSREFENRGPQVVEGVTIFTRRKLH
ncbi:MAG TPA: hypothetical protein VG448_12640 [Solirubrobacterales bacterium]|nr:hypothetical protein [Solirubrobacterales bacterium]